MDTLSKFSHDSDPEVAYSAILAMGIIGAGTNNARLGGLLRQLAQFYCKDPSALYIVRLAQVRCMLPEGLPFTWYCTLVLPPRYTGADPPWERHPHAQPLPQPPTAHVAGGCWGTPGCAHGSSGLQEL